MLSYPELSLLNMYLLQGDFLLVLLLLEIKESQICVWVSSGLDGEW